MSLWPLRNFARADDRSTPSRVPTDTRRTMSTSPATSTTSPAIGIAAEETKCSRGELISRMALDVWRQPWRPNLPTARALAQNSPELRSRNLFVVAGS